MRAFDRQLVRGIHFALALGLSAMLGCAGETDPTKPSYWVERLNKKPTRIEALKELGKMGPAAKEAVSAVVPWLKEKGDWQPDAAFTLGEIGDSSVAKELVSAIDHTVGVGRDRDTRLANRLNQNIARALAKLEAVDAVPELVRLLDSPEPKTRNAVVRAVGTIGGAAAEAPLIEVVKEDDDPAVRNVAIAALGEMRSKTAIPTLVEMMFVVRDNISHYGAARFSLIQLGDASVKPLIDTLQHRNTTVEGITVEGESLAPAAIEAKAGSVLGALQARAAEGPMVGAHGALYQKWKRSNDKNLLGPVVEMTYALGDLGSNAALRAIIKVVGDGEPAIRIAASESLTTIGDPAAVPALIAAAKTGSLDGRVAAVIAASQIGSGGDLAEFDALGTGDLAPAVKAERIRLEVAKECGSDADCWQNKLGDPDPRIVARAASMLGRLNAKAAVGALMIAAEHESPQVRLAAVLALEDLAAVDVEKFRTILADASKRREFAPVNMQMERMIAVSSAKGK